MDCQAVQYLVLLVQLMKTSENEIFIFIIFYFLILENMRLYFYETLDFKSLEGSLEIEPRDGF